MNSTAMNSTPVIVWFRLDLRLADNPALNAAAATGSPIIPLFTWCPREEGAWPAGSASRWWLHRTLEALEVDLSQRGAQLIYRAGPSAQSLVDLAKESGARAVFCNSRLEPDLIERDRQVERMLHHSGVEWYSYNSSVLFDPRTITTLKGTPYAVFTPYYRACLSAAEPSQPIKTPESIAWHVEPVSSVKLEQLKLLPKINWYSTMEKTWQPGEAGALRRLRKFSEDLVQDYDHNRDRPDLDGVSMLSPFLHFGCISPRQVWHVVQRARAESANTVAAAGCTTYLKELVWREFAHYLLLHFPNSINSPLRDEFRRFPWVRHEDELERWQQGLTGYPVVDAGMRQLWATGWMHNRVRMIVASFLVKDLLHSWLEGARWFWDTLVDADLANNTLGWQWSAGCGSDAAPYFRVFNPVLQGKKFDPDGAYVRQWVPELSELPSDLIHAPFELDHSVLRAANVSIGTSYPAPMVDHKEARKRALEAFSRIKTVASKNS